MGRIFAVGDIHGALDKLSAMLDKLVIDRKTDSLLFIGDYVDRGPQSFEVVDLLVEVKRLYPETIFLRGNHEAMFLEYLSGENRFNFLANGGHSTLEGYRRRAAPDDPLPVPAEHLTFLESTVLRHETDRYIFVHAGMRPRIPLAQQVERDLLWIRHDFIQSDCDFGKQVVFGHTPFKEPLVTRHKIGIDTGAV